MKLGLPALPIRFAFELCHVFKVAQLIKASYGLIYIECRKQRHVEPILSSKLCGAGTRCGIDGEVEFRMETRRKPSLSRNG